MSSLRRSHRLWPSFLLLAWVVSGEMAMTVQDSHSPGSGVNADPSRPSPTIAPSIMASFGPHGHGATSSPTTGGTPPPTVAPADGTNAPTTTPEGSSAPTPKDAPTISPTSAGTAPTVAPTTPVPTAPTTGTAAPTPASSVTTAPPTIVGSTLAPTPAGTTASPTLVPTPLGTTVEPTLSPTKAPMEPTSEPSGPPTPHKKKLTFWRILGKTIAWLIIIALSVVGFGAVMSNRYRIYYFLRGVWYTILSMECTMWIMRKLRLGDSASVDPALNTIIFDNEMSEGLLMRNT